MTAGVCTAWHPSAFPWSMPVKAQGWSLLGTGHCPSQCPTSLFTFPLDLQDGVRHGSTYTPGAPPGRRQMDWRWTGGRGAIVEVGLACFCLPKDGDLKLGAQCQGRWHEWQLFQWLVCSACLLTRCPVPTCHGLTSPFPAPSRARDGCRHGNPAHSVRDNEANVFFISMSWSASRAGEGLSLFSPSSGGRGRLEREGMGSDRRSPTHQQKRGETWSHQALAYHGSHVSGQCWLGRPTPRPGEAARQSGTSFLAV